MLRAVLLALVFGTATAQFHEARQVAMGLADGFLFGSTIKSCVQNSKATVLDVTAAIKDFEKKDATDVLNGLRELGEALKQFPEALQECKTAEADVKQVIDAFEQIRSPQQFAYHVGKNLLVNHHDIFTEINTAVADYKSSEFEDLGFQVGQALRKLTVGVEGRFEEFMAFHNKSYSPLERSARLKVFAENLVHIYRMQQNEEGTAVYSHLSPFADISLEEFSKRNGFKYDSQQASVARVAEMLHVEDLPDSIDWVAKGAVNAVKNQQQCGSCWAFATVANIEGAGFVETGKLRSLSEQELVDCDKDDHGCQGGLPKLAYEDMIQNSIGLELESAYPYTSEDGTCKKDASNEIVSITAWQQISTDEDQIAAALVKYGPLAIGINADPMQMYSGGISNPDLCNPKSLDHGVAIVGYGVESSKKYWKIRNSWGASWGEQGYYRIIRGVGKCGLNTMVTTATGIQIKDSPTLVV